MGHNNFTIKLYSYWSKVRLKKKIILLKLYIPSIFSWHSQILSSVQKFQTSLNVEKNIYYYIVLLSIKLKKYSPQTTVIICYTLLNFSELTKVVTKMTQRSFKVQGDCRCSFIYSLSQVNTKNPDKCAFNKYHPLKLNVAADTPTYKAMFWH